MWVKLVIGLTLLGCAWAQIGAPIYVKHNVQDGLVIKVFHNGRRILSNNDHFTDISSSKLFSSTFVSQSFRVEVLDSFDDTVISEKSIGAGLLPGNVYNLGLSNNDFITITPAVVEDFSNLTHIEPEQSPPSPPPDDSSSAMRLEWLIFDLILDP